jgi:hypothetical protein
MPEIPGIPPVPVSAPPPVPETPPVPVPVVPAIPVPVAPPVAFPHVLSPQPTPGNGTKIVLLGCLGAALLAAGLVGAGVWWFGKKVKGAIENPEQFIAEMAVKANPDLELVTVDKETRQVTIKNKKSGETSTFTFDEVKDGKISLKNSDGSSAEVGPGGIRVKDKDGAESVIGTGAGSLVPLPEWVPAYPGAHQVVMSSQKLQGTNQTGQYAFTTRDPAQTAAASYVKVLEAAQFEVTKEAASATVGATVITLEAKAALEGGGRERISIRLIGQGGDSTMVTLDYAHEESPAVE